MRAHRRLARLVLACLAVPFVEVGLWLVEACERVDPIVPDDEVRP